MVDHFATDGHLTSRTIHTAAWRCCRLAVDAVTPRHGHTTWTRELLAMPNDDPPSQALHSSCMPAPRYARKTYTRRCLTPPDDAPVLPNRPRPAASAPADAARQRNAELAAA